VKKNFDGFNLAMKENKLACI